MTSCHKRALLRSISLILILGVSLHAVSGDENDDCEIESYLLDGLGQQDVSSDVTSQKKRSPRRKNSDVDQSRSQAKPTQRHTRPTKKAKRDSGAAPHKSKAKNQVPQNQELLVTPQSLSWPCTGISDRILHAVMNGTSAAFVDLITDAASKGKRVLFFDTLLTTRSKTNTILPRQANVNSAYDANI